jgi:hypothetical protein
MVATNTDEFDNCTWDFGLVIPNIVALYITASSGGFFIMVGLGGVLVGKDEGLIRYMIDVGAGVIDVVGIGDIPIRIETVLSPSILIFWVGSEIK